MSKKIMHYSFLFLLWLGLAACNPPITIDAPLNGSINTSAPSQYKISYQTQPTPLPSITLNGVSVESLFVAGPTSAVANGGDLAKYLKEGANKFQVDPPFGNSVEFVYNVAGPEILVLSADANNPIAITGIVETPVGVKNLVVNGVITPTTTSTTASATSKTDGAFTTANENVATSDVYSFGATDINDHLKYSQFSRLGLASNPSISFPSLSLRINQSGMDAVTDLVKNMLNGMDFNALVGGTKLYDTTWKGPLGETYGADGYLDSMSVSSSGFDWQFGTGSSTFSGTLTNVHAALTLTLHNGLLPPTIIHIGAAVGPITFNGNLATSAVNHQPVITLSNFGFNIGAIVLDSTPSLFNAIISGVSTGLLNTLSPAISNAVAKGLNAALPGIIAQVIQKSYPVSMEGLDMSMVLQLEDLTVDNKSLLVSLSGSMAPVSINQLIPQPLSMYSPDPLPVAAAGIGDFALAMNSNLLNQILASAFSVGLMDVNTVTAADGTKVGQFGLPHDDTIGADGDKRTLIDMLTPPQMQGTTFYVHGIRYTIQTKTLGVWKTNFSVRMNLKVDAVFTIDPGSKLNLSFVNVPDISIIGIAIGDGPELPFVVDAAINQQISVAVGGLITQLANPLTALHVPDFGCYEMRVDSYGPVGLTNGHLGIVGGLFKTSTACDNPVAASPKVAYGRGVGIPMVCSSTLEYDAGLCYTPCNAGYDGVGPVCWAQNASYGRGVGTIPTYTCGSQQMDAGLCYPYCNAGYNGVGPVCWSTQPLSYGRGVGTIPSLIPYTCGSKQMDAGLCYPYCNAGYTGVGPVCWLNNASYGRGVGTVPYATCGSGQDLDAGLCYPTCNTGYHGVGPVCWTNNALSYGRGVGLIPDSCPTGMDQDAGLCYQQCAAGYTAIGPVCWPQ